MTSVFRVSSIREAMVSIPFSSVKQAVKTRTEPTTGGGSSAKSRGNAGTNASRIRIAPIA
jgi:hypothetical protein